MGQHADEPEPADRALAAFEIVDVSAPTGATEPGGAAVPAWATLWSSLRVAPRTVQLAAASWTAAAVLAVVSPFLNYTSYSFPAGDGRPITFWYSGWGVITASQSDGVTISGHGTRYGIGLTVLAAALVLGVAAILLILSPWPLTLAMIAGGALAGLAWTIRLDASSYVSTAPGAAAGAGVVVALVAGILALAGSLAAAATVARATAKGH
jgi:hypothetical protein